MSDTKALISQLDEKVEALLNHVKKQNSDLEKSNQEIEQLKKELAEKESKITALTEENESIKNAPAQQEDQDTQDMKVRIGELVKEIDNCISLLKV